MWLYLWCCSAIPEEDAGVGGEGGGGGGTDSALNPATPDSDTTLTEKILSGKEVSASTFQREFELDDVLAYVKTGIASIIEDEVTQRFVSEELKVRSGQWRNSFKHYSTWHLHDFQCWNLLSRTSQSFEFVNVKLTVIWILGTIIRYGILLPGRFLILLVGVSCST